MRRFFHSWIRLFKVIYETYLGLLILFIEEVERDYRATTLCSSCKFYIFFKQELFIIYTNIVLLIKLLPISHYLRYKFLLPLFLQYFGDIHFLGRV